MAIIIIIIIIISGHIFKSQIPKLILFD